MAAAGSPTPKSLPLDTEHGRGPATHSLGPPGLRKARPPFPQRVSDSAGATTSSRGPRVSRGSPSVAQLGPARPAGGRTGHLPAHRAPKSSASTRTRKSSRKPRPLPPPDPEPGGVASPAPPPPPRATGSVPPRVRAPLTRGPTARARAPDTGTPLCARAAAAWVSALPGRARAAGLHSASRPPCSPPRLRWRNPSAQQARGRDAHPSGSPARGKGCAGPQFSRVNGAPRVATSAEQRPTGLGETK